MATSITHPVLGTLRWEPEHSRWLGEVRFTSCALGDLVIDPGEAGVDFLDKAAALCLRLLAAEPRIRREAAVAKDGILDLYRHWRDADDPELTAEGLASRLEPVFLRIDTVVPVILSYALGERNEVFGGHAIDVELNDKLEIKAVNLVG